MERQEVNCIEKGYFGAGNDPEKTAEPDGTIDYDVIKSVKRNKKVDVPTEQWQKNVERKLEILMDRVTALESHTDYRPLFKLDEYNKDPVGWEKKIKDMNPHLWPDADE